MSEPSGSLTFVHLVYLLVLLNCLFNISPYKFVPRIPVLLSGNTPSAMGPSIMAWNETTNSHDDDDLTSHSLLLTSSLLPRQEAASLPTSWTKVKHWTQVLPCAIIPLLITITIQHLPPLIKLSPLIKIQQRVLPPLRINYLPLLKPLVENFTKNTTNQYWLIANGKRVLLSHPFSLLTPPLGISFGVAMMMILPSPSPFTHPLYNINPRPPALYLLHHRHPLVTNPPPTTILSHPFSLLTSPLSNWIAMIMILLNTTTFPPTMITLSIPVALNDFGKNTASTRYSLIAKPLASGHWIALTMIPLNTTKIALNDFGTNTANRY